MTTKLELKRLTEEKFRNAFYNGNVLSVEDMKIVGATITLQCVAEIELGVVDLNEILKAIEEGVKK